MLSYSVVQWLIGHLSDFMLHLNCATVSERVMSGLRMPQYLVPLTVILLSASLVFVLGHSNKILFELRSARVGSRTVKSEFIGLGLRSFKHL